MASSKDYLQFVLEQLSELQEITYRAMMGEFIIYYRGKIVGGIYDDRLLVKPTKSAISYMPTVQHKHLNFIGRHTSTNECIPRTSHLTKKIRQERSPSIIDFTNLSLPESWITSEILRTFGRYLARRTHLRSSEAMSTIMARPRHSTHAPTLSGTVPKAVLRNGM